VLSLLSCYAATLSRESAHLLLPAVHTECPFARFLTFAHHDDADELLSAGPASFTYDGNGSRLTASGLGFETTYSWNSANRLVSVSEFFQGKEYGGVQYQYDGKGTRISQNAGFETHSYVNDVLRRLPVVMTDQGRAGTTDYVSGYGIIAAATDAWDEDYLVSDGLGSTVDITDSSGQVEQSLFYDPWGNTDGFGGIPYKFVGQALYSDNLYYMNARVFEGFRLRGLRFAMSEEPGFGRDYYRWAPRNPQPEPIFPVAGAGQWDCRARVSGRLRRIRFKNDKGHLLLTPNRKRSGLLRRPRSRKRLTPKPGIAVGVKGARTRQTRLEIADLGAVMLALRNSRRLT
jgi:hypothetical protein